MKPEYALELERADMDRVSGAFQKYGPPELSSDPGAYKQLLVDALPDGAGKRIIQADSVAVTSIEFAPSLIPFYDLQIVPVCAHCIQGGRYSELDALAVLEPMLDAGLVIPVMSHGIEKYPERVLNLLARSPRIPVSARTRLPHARIVAGSEPTDKLPCSVCPEADSCTKVDSLFRARGRLMDVAWNDSDRAVIANIVHTSLAFGPDVADGIGEAILTAAESDLDERVRSIDDLLRHLDSLLFAASLDGRAALSERMLLKAGAPAFDLPVQSESLQQDAELRLSVAEQLGIIAAPAGKLSAYVEAVAPYAGALVRAFGTDWVVDPSTGREAIDVAASIAGEVNESAARLAKAESRFRAIGTAVSHPLVRTAAWTVIGAKVSPLLAACGITGEALSAVKGALDKSIDKAPGAFQLPKTLESAIEDTFRLAPATFAVHGMRKAIARSRT